jgi:uncharacterized tellurite resistance protein B-like protein
VKPAGLHFPGLKPLSALDLLPGPLAAVSRFRSRDAARRAASFPETTAPHLPMSDSPARTSSELEGMLFDLMYLTMNADGEAHASEKELIDKLKARLSRDERVEVESRVERLRPVVDDGTDAVRERALELADDVAELADEEKDQLAGSYMTLLKGMILADEEIAEEERTLFNDLCRRWDIEDQLPASG